MLEWAKELGPLGVVAALGLVLAIIVVLGGGPTILKIIRAVRGRNNRRKESLHGEPLPLPLPRPALDFDMEPGVVKYRLERLEKAVLDPETGLVVEVHFLKETCSAIPEISQGVTDLKKSQPIYIKQVVDAINGVREAAAKEARKAVEEEFAKRGLP